MDTQEMDFAAWILQTKPRCSGRSQLCETAIPPQHTEKAVGKQRKVISLGVCIAAFALLSYGLVVRWSAPADSPGEDPPSSPSRFIQPPRLDTALVPAGTTINIRLNEVTGIERRIPSDRFTAVLYGPLIVGAKLLAPSRSKITGQFTQVNEPGGFERQEMVLRKLLVNGSEYDLATDPLILVRTCLGPVVTGDLADKNCEAILTFRLSNSLELPVIRTMGGTKGGSGT